MILLTLENSQSLVEIICFVSVRFRVLLHTRFVARAVVYEDTDIILYFILFIILLLAVLLYRAIE